MVLTEAGVSGQVALGRLLYRVESSVTLIPVRGLQSNLSLPLWFGFHPPLHFSYTCHFEQLGTSQVT